MRGKRVEVNEQFKVELTDLINRYSLENGSNTPDFVLAEHLCECLETFNRTAVKRYQWYKGVDMISEEFTSPILDEI
jgi:hypothetical protein